MAYNNFSFVYAVLRVNDLGSVMSKTARAPNKQSDKLDRAQRATSAKASNLIETDPGFEFGFPD